MNLDDSKKKLIEIRKQLREKRKQKNDIQLEPIPISNKNTPVENPNPPLHLSPIKHPVIHETNEKDEIAHSQVKSLMKIFEKK